MFNVKKERSYLLQAFSIQLRHMKILCSAGQTNAVKSKNTTYYKSKILRALSAAAACSRAAVETSRLSTTVDSGRHTARTLHYNARGSKGSCDDAVCTAASSNLHQLAPVFLGIVLNSRTAKHSKHNYAPYPPRNMTQNHNTTFL